MTDTAALEFDASHGPTATRMIADLCPGPEWQAVAETLVTRMVAVAEQPSGSPARERATCRLVGVIDVIDAWPGQPLGHGGATITRAAAEIMNDAVAEMAELARCAGVVENPTVDEALQAAQDPERPVQERIAIANMITGDPT